jgi:hypothetical protein
MAFNPSRRLIVFPAWAWLLFPPVLVLLAYMLGVPRPLSEPRERADLFSPVILVARDGDSFRFVAWGSHQGITPLWAMTCLIRENTKTERSFAWGSVSKLGFWKLAGKWQYDLASLRFDKDWKSGKEPLSLPPADLIRLRPLVIEELNRRSPNEHRGDRLAQVLDNGIERSSYVCVENAVILLAWLSLPMAVLSIVSMFIQGRGRATKVMPPSHHENNRPPIS